MLKEGQEIEESLLGKVTAPENIEKMKSIDYITYESAKNLVKRMQRWSDPSDPEPGFANDLHASLAEELNLDDFSELKYYTAVGSKLDYFHKVDAFFEWEVPNFDQKKCIALVTVDLTINPNKLKSGMYKADILVFIDDDVLDDKEKYLRNMKEWSNKMSSVLKEEEKKCNKMKKI